MVASQDHLIGIFIIPSSTSVAFIHLCKLCFFKGNFQIPFLDVPAPICIIWKWPKTTCIRISYRWEHCSEQSLYLNHSKTPQNNTGISMIRVRNNTMKGGLVWGFFLCAFFVWFCFDFWYFFSKRQSSQITRKNIKESSYYVVKGIIMHKNICCFT